VAPFFIRYNLPVEPASPSVVRGYAEADRIVRDQAALLDSPNTTETLPLLETVGRVLAVPIFADRDQPPFSRSTRDGFACRAADLAQGSALTVIGRIRAGEEWTGPAITEGQAVEIMTGAPVPPSADCVLMVEHAVIEGSRIRPDRQVPEGENIVPAGAEARSGAKVIPAGTRIGPQHVATAAACGHPALLVYCRPRVAILATGDEIVPVANRPLTYQIRNSNSYSIAAQVLQHGGEPILSPIVPDDLAAIEEAIHKALSCDLFILSGGVSMGKYDFVEQALLNLGAEFFFTGVRMQPGRPVVFGQLPSPVGAKRYFFGLPGNPVSTMVTFALFAAPLLSALSGQSKSGIGPRFAEAVVAATMTYKPGLTRFLPALLESDCARPSVRPIPWHGSGDQAAAAQANCFIVVPEEGGDLSLGTPVRILPL
jgi:molybdopterin molybdotransferase